MSRRRKRLKAARKAREAEALYRQAGVPCALWLGPKGLTLVKEKRR